MSVNDSSRIFHPSAAQAPPAAAALGPVPTSTTSAPPPTINTTAAPPALPPRAAVSPTTTTSPTHQTHPATTAVASALPTFPSSATHSTLSGGRDPSRVSSQSERSGRSVVVQDGLYPISAFVLKQGVSLGILDRKTQPAHVPRVVSVLTLFSSRYTGSLPSLYVLENIITPALKLISVFSLFFSPFRRDRSMDDFRRSHWSY